MENYEKLDILNINEKHDLHGKRVEVNGIARGIARNRFASEYSVSGFLQDSGNFLLFEWNPDFYFTNKERKELSESEKFEVSNRAFKNQKETSKLVSMLKASSETNTPISVRGVIFDMKKKELAPEEYFLQVIGVKFRGYTAGDYSEAQSVHIPLTQDFVKRVY